MAQSLDFWSLKCFVALAEELHFGRAAKHLGMTQPTLSQHIKRLEANLHVQVFKRTTRSVVLTSGGAAFLPLARDLLVKLEEAVVVSKLAAGGMSPGGEQLRIGAIEPAAYTLLPAIIRRFRSRFPKTHLDITILDSSELLRALERGECHVGLMRVPTNANVIRFRSLTSDRFVAVIPKSLAIARQKTLRMADFAKQKVFTLNRFELTSFKTVYDQVLASGIKPNPNIHVSDTTAALAAASAGIGITFLPGWIQGRGDKDIVVRRVEDLNHEISIGIGWRADDPTPGILPFVEYAELVSKKA